MLATQNPIEQEGTYPLPEAQVDRFMLKLKVSYPDKVEEKEIMRRMAHREKPEVQPVLSPEDIKCDALRRRQPSTSTRRWRTTSSRSSSPPASPACTSSTSSTS